MASLFGTLGRRREKKKEEGQPKYTSTPNLNKLNNKKLSLPQGDYDHNQTWHNNNDKSLIHSRSDSIDSTQKGQFLSPKELYYKDSMRNVSSVSSLVNTLRQSKRSFSYRSAINIDDAQSNYSSPSRSETTSYQSVSSSIDQLEGGSDTGIVISQNGEENRYKFLKTDEEAKYAQPMDGYKSLEKTFARRKKRERQQNNNNALAQNEEVINEEEKAKMNNLMVQGIKKFNTSPKKGVEFLVENKFLHFTPEHVAKFLMHGEGLSKTAVGNYLGEKIDFNELVLKEFVKLHDFKDVNLVQALRQFLWSFRLPGESQKIDRMMEVFATHYHEQNPGVFSSSDTCYVLSFSIIMLNTTLHNPAVKHKPTVEDFIRMNRDVDGGKSLRKSFLASLYFSIQDDQFKIPPEDGNDLMLTFFNPDIEGWLWKEGSRYKSWKCRWFILSNNCLYYFKYTTDKTPKGIIPLENIEVDVVPDHIKSKKNCYGFILYKEAVGATQEHIKACKTLHNGATVPQNYNFIHLAALNIKDREKWVRAIRMNNSHSQFYSDLTLKKVQRQQSELAEKRKRAQTMASGLTKPVFRKSQIGSPSTFYTDLDLNSSSIHRYQDPNSYFEVNNVQPIIASDLINGSPTDPQIKYIDDIETDATYEDIGEPLSSTDVAQKSDYEISTSPTVREKSNSSRLSRIDEISPNGKTTQHYYQHTNNSENNANYRESPNPVDNRIPDNSIPPLDSKIFPKEVTSNNIHHIKIDTSEIENENRNKSSSSSSEDGLIETPNSNYQTNSTTNHNEGSQSQFPVQMRTNKKNSTHAYDIHRVSVGNKMMLMRVNNNSCNPEKSRKVRNTVFDNGSQITRCSSNTNSKIRIIYSPKRHNSAPDEIVTSISDQLEQVNFKSTAEMKTDDFVRGNKIGTENVTSDSHNLCDHSSSNGNNSNKICDEKG